MLTPAHVELYCKIKSDPFRHAGFRVDSALIFCQQVEARLDRFSECTRRLILLRGMGYTQSEIAMLNGFSVRRVVRQCERVKRIAFGELHAAMERAVEGESAT